MFTDIGYFEVYVSSDYKKKEYTLYKCAYKWGLNLILRFLCVTVINSIILYVYVVKGNSFYGLCISINIKCFHISYIMCYNLMIHKTFSN